MRLLYDFCSPLVQGFENWEERFPNGALKRFSRVSRILGEFYMGIHNGFHKYFFNKIHVSLPNKA